MKFIYGLNTSGISVINFLIVRNESFVVWDDNENKRQVVSSIFKKIIFKHPNDLDFSKVKEAYITPGIDLNNSSLYHHFNIIC